MKFSSISHPPLQQLPLSVEAPSRIQAVPSFTPTAFSLPTNVTLLFCLLSLLLVSFWAVTKSQRIHQVITIIFKRELLPPPDWGCCVKGCLGWGWLWWFGITDRRKFDQGLKKQNHGKYRKSKQPCLLFSLSHFYIVFLCDQSPQRVTKWQCTPSWSVATHLLMGQPWVL